MHTKKPIGSINQIENLIQIFLPHRKKKKDALNDNGNIWREIYSSFVSVEMGHTLF